MATVKVTILEARDLPVMDRSSGLADPYVVVKMDDMSETTHTCPKTRNPVWNSDFRFDTPDLLTLQEDPLEMRVYDYDMFSRDDLIGLVFIDLNCMLGRPGHPTMSEEWLPIFDTMHGLRGELKVSVKLKFHAAQNPFNPVVPRRTINIHEITHKLILSPPTAATTTAKTKGGPDDGPAVSTTSDAQMGSSPLIAAGGVPANVPTTDSAAVQDNNPLQQPQVLDIGVAYKAETQDDVLLPSTSNTSRSLATEVAGVYIFSMSRLDPSVLRVEKVLGMAEELLVKPDPEQSTLTSLRSSRVTYEARLLQLYKLSGKVRRQLTKKVLELGCNCVLGYSESFDFEANGIIVRASGTPCVVSSVGHEHHESTVYHQRKHHHHHHHGHHGHHQHKPALREASEVSGIGGGGAGVENLSLVAGMSTTTPATSIPPPHQRSSSTAFETPPSSGGGMTPLFGAGSVPPPGAVVTGMDRQGTGASGSEVSSGGGTSAALMLPNLSAAAIATTSGGTGQPGARPSPQLGASTPLSSHLQTFAGMTSSGTFFSPDPEGGAHAMGMFPQVSTDFAFIAGAPGSQTNPFDSEMQRQITSIEGANAGSSSGNVLSDVSVVKDGRSAGETGPDMEKQQQRNVREIAVGTDDMDEENRKALARKTARDVIILTIGDLPAGSITSIGGTVCARSVKIVSKLKSKAAISQERDAAWMELREEIKGNTRAFHCNAILNYSEETVYYEDIVLMSITGTAVTLDEQWSAMRAGPETLFSKLRHRAAHHRQCALLHLHHHHGEGGLEGGGERHALCGVCHRRSVPECIILSSSMPSEIEVEGQPRFVEVRVVRPKPDARGVDLALAVSQALPFVEYNINRQLLFRMKLWGLNCGFNLNIQIRFSENLIFAVASVTAVRAVALPAPKAPNLAIPKHLLKTPHAVKIMAALQQVKDMSEQVAAQQTNAVDEETTKNGGESERTRRSPKLQGQQPHNASKRSKMGKSTSAEPGSSPQQHAKNRRKSTTDTPSSGEKRSKRRKSRRNSLGTVSEHHNSDDEHVDRHARGTSQRTVSSRCSSTTMCSGTCSECSSDDDGWSSSVSSSTETVFSSMSSEELEGRDDVNEYLIEIDDMEELESMLGLFDDVPQADALFLSLPYLPSDPNLFTAAQRVVVQRRYNIEDFTGIDDITNCISDSRKALLFQLGKYARGAEGRKCIILSFKNEISFTPVSDDLHIRMSGTFATIAKEDVKVLEDRALLEVHKLAGPVSHHHGHGHGHHGHHGHGHHHHGGHGHHHPGLTPFGSLHQLKPSAALLLPSNTGVSSHHNIGATDLGSVSTTEPPTVLNTHHADAVHRNTPPLTSVSAPSSLSVAAETSTGADTTKPMLLLNPATPDTEHHKDPNSIMVKSGMTTPQLSASPNMGTQHSTYVGDGSAMGSSLNVPPPASFLCADENANGTGTAPPSPARTPEVAHSHGHPNAIDAQHLAQQAHYQQVKACFIAATAPYTLPYVFDGGDRDGEGGDAAGPSGGDGHDGETAGGGAGAGGEETAGDEQSGEAKHATQVAVVDDGGEDVASGAQAMLERKLTKLTDMATKTFRAARDNAKTVISRTTRNRNDDKQDGFGNVGGEVAPTGRRQLRRHATGVGAIPQSFRVIEEDYTPVLVTPVSFIPGKNITRYVGRISHHFIREERNIDTHSKLAGFFAQVEIEIHSVITALVTAMGGDALIDHQVTSHEMWDSDGSDTAFVFTTVTGHVVCTTERVKKSVLHQHQHSQQLPPIGAEGAHSVSC